ncbi:MAG: rubrerythrin family protein [Victivallaceae bacterium]|nr:rubrerythrin family protein [Victivallaceae bacterium]
MSKQISVMLSVVAALLMGFGIGCQEDSKLAQTPLAAETVTNLQAAFDGESNASAKYAMYAKHAAEEGYQSVAALFHAASASESRHAARHSKVLKAHGIEPKSEIKLPAYKDLKTALADALKGETYEMTTMYPDFIKQAKAINAPADVIEAFTFALEAEKEHAGFYAAALKDLAAWKAAGKTFYVCTICGYTTDKKPSVCILCAAPGEKFEIFQ